MKNLISLLGLLSFTALTLGSGLAVIFVGLEFAARVFLGSALILTFCLISDKVIKD